MLCPTLFHGSHSDPIQSNLTDSQWSRRKQRMFAALSLGTLIALAGCGSDADDVEPVDPVEPGAAVEAVADEELAAAEAPAEPVFDLSDEWHDEPEHVDTDAFADLLGGAEEPAAVQTVYERLREEADALNAEADVQDRLAWSLTQQAKTAVQTAKANRDRAEIDAAFAVLADAERTHVKAKTLRQDVRDKRDQADTAEQAGRALGAMLGFARPAPSATGDAFGFAG